MSTQVKKSGQCHLREKKHQYFSIVSLPTDSVIADHAVLLLVILLFNVIVDINIGVLAYLTQYIKCQNDVRTPMC
jgi:hypothetical protein